MLRASAYLRGAKEDAFAGPSFAALIYRHACASHLLSDTLWDAPDGNACTLLLVNQGTCRRQEDKLALGEPPASQFRLLKVRGYGLGSSRNGAAEHSSVVAEAVLT
jgi:hypothetical protein